VIAEIGRNEAAAEKEATVIRLTHILTTAALVAAFAAPASAATFEDMHPSGGSPEPAADTGFRTSYQPVPPSDQPQTAYVLDREYGSPDAADAARELPPVQITAVEPQDVSSGGFDWGDAGIGAAGMFGLFGLAGASALFLTGRRRRLA
jgi:hypothetical protein